MIVDTPKPLKLDAHGIVVCGCNPCSGLVSVPRGEENSCISGGCVTVDIPEPPGYGPLPKDLPGVKMADGPL